MMVSGLRPWPGVKSKSPAPCTPNVPDAPTPMKGTPLPPPALAVLHRLARGERSFFLLCEFFPPDVSHFAASRRIRNIFSPLARIRFQRGFCDTLGRFPNRLQVRICHSENLFLSNMARKKAVTGTKVITGNRVIDSVAPFLKLMIKNQ